MNKLDRKKFDEEGFLVLESVFSLEECKKLQREIEAHIATGLMPLTKKDAHQELITHNSILKVCDELMGGVGFRFHHLHSARHEEGMKSMGWHHDYELADQPRKHLMLHFLIYLSGLNGEIGELLVVPGSHRMLVKSRQFFKKDFDFFEGYKVIDKLAPGSLVVINSATIHSRRARSGGGNSPRYFIDLSYCQETTKWPRYCGRNDWGNVLANLSLWAKDDRARLIVRDDCYFTPLNNYFYSRLRNIMIPKISKIRKNFKAFFA
ncbi:phytanoyl-CoA dioxygenase family protein [Polynucleobacter sp. VK25]|uniref:phytanoyl-CoA dioxygenase family protein n=1 Tax=Polynucleobacter sp. VK25 TaxID=1758398 RepID=UPI001BFE54AB|nr:phytanoyl-CoA dioxygenase family protein [Polynucleobacter sp. VK25]QWD68650.1 phytanoyl-CoA dioxygenase family protein [Polynucleobacter sp. VK25]